MNAKRTSAPPRVIDGVTFECWHVGILQTEWRSVDKLQFAGLDFYVARICAGRRAGRRIYYLVVDGRLIGSKYRSIDGALQTGVKITRLKRKDTAK